MSELKPNSHKYKAEQQNAATEEKRAKTVIKGTTRKKSEIRKVADIFISDNVNDIKEHLLMDLLVPTVKKAILTTIDMLLNGGNTTYGRESNQSKVSYRKYYDSPRDNDRHPTTTSTRSRFDSDEIVFPSRGVAEAVLNEMDNILREYGLVRVADLYDIAELPQPYTSNRYGWMNLRNAEVIRVSDGYVIRMPKAMPID